MEIITLSGKIMSEPEIKTDKNGNNYIHFRVSCIKKIGNEEKYTIYRCYSYNFAEFKGAKTGDSIFLSGDLDITRREDVNGTVWTNNDIFIKQVTIISTPK